MMEGNQPIETEENSTDDVDEFLHNARKRARRALEFWNSNFEVSKRDLDYLYSDNQWDEKAAKEREDEGRPSLTLNQLPQYKRQIVNEMRLTTPKVQVTPYHSDAATEEEEPKRVSNITNTTDYSMAETLEGLIRNVENVSKADSHYDRVGQQAVESGFGWLRLLTHYQNLDSFEQEAKITSVKNRFSVLCDPEFTEPDTSDKNFLFIGELMHKDEFEARYPKAIIGEIGTSDEYSWWTEGEYVRIAEYFYRKPTERELLLLSDERVVYRDKVEPVLDELEENGITIVAKRKVTVWKCCWAKITANSILEGGVTKKDEMEWPGETIPVFPCFGEELTFSKKTLYVGATHFAMDSQTMGNYWWTAATERVALAPKAPWVASAEAIEGYEEEWEGSNVGNPAVLPWNERDDDEQPNRPPQRADFSSMPAAEIQLAMSATDITKSVMGMYDASLGNRSNEKSGVAIQARQQQSNTGNFHFTGNRDMCIEGIGRCLVEVLPRIYSNEQVRRVMFEDGKGDWVKINEMITDEESGQKIIVNDLTVGKFDVVVTSGPAFNTQRQDAVDSMLRFVESVPDVGRILLDLIAENMDWHLSKEASNRLKRQLPREMLTEEEAKELGYDDKEPQMTPDQQFEIEKGQSEAEKAKADAAKESEKVKQSTVSLEIEREKVEKARIELEKMQVEAQKGDVDFAIVAEMVAQAMARIKIEESKQEKLTSVVV